MWSTLSMNSIRRRETDGPGASCAVQNAGLNPSLAFAAGASLR